MFSSDNYSSPGQWYDYDTLNEILLERLNGSEDPDDIKNYSDRINNEMTEKNGLFYVGDRVVGGVEIDE